MAVTRTWPISAIGQKFGLETPWWWDWVNGKLVLDEVIQLIQNSFLIALIISPCETFTALNQENTYFDS